MGGKQNFYASLKSLKKEVGSGVGSGSGYSSQRYGSADPDPHQKIRIHNAGFRYFLPVSYSVLKFSGKKYSFTLGCNGYGSILHQAK
jgi:hypothetical protein